MGRANVGTKDSGPRLHHRRDRRQGRDLRRADGGQKTLPPWHRIELEKGGLPIVAAGRPAGGPNAIGRRPAAARLRRQRPYPQVRERWRFDAGWTIASSAAVVRRDGRLRRRLGLRPGPAHHRRQHRLGVQDGRSGLLDARVAGGRVVFGCTNGTIYCPGRPDRDGSSGRSRPADPSSPARASPTASSTSARAITSSGPSSWPPDGSSGARTASTDSSRRSRSSPATWSSSAPGTAAFTPSTRRPASPSGPGRGKRQSRYYSPAACWPVAAERAASSSSPRTRG